MKPVNDTYLTVFVHLHKGKVGRAPEPVAVVVL